MPKCNHKYIGGRAEKDFDFSGMPIECVLCNNILFAEKAFYAKTAVGRELCLCPKCQEKMGCGGCGRGVKIDDLHIGECVECGMGIFLCKRCARKGLISADKMLAMHQAISMQKLKEAFGSTILLVNIILPYQNPNIYNEEEEEEWR